MVASLVSLPFAFGAALIRSTRMLAEAPGAIASLRAIPDLAAAIDRLATVTEGGALDQLAETGESLGRLAEAADALHALADAVDSLEVLADAGSAIRELSRTAPDLARLAEAVESLAQLAAMRTVLEEIAVAGQSLPRLAAVDESLVRLAGASEALDRLSHMSTVLPALAASARNLPQMPERIDALDAGVTRTLERLEAVEPDLRQLANTILQLDESIGVLADALGPLQGTTERLGRIVDRLPTRRPATT
jgi:DNA repair ATPase RecN